MGAMPSNPTHLLRIGPLMMWAGGSVVAVVLLVYLLCLEARPENAQTDRPLRVCCAAALKPVLQDIATEYERETGQRIECEFGDSGQMLTSSIVRPDSDLFLPADDSFIRLAQEKGLVAEVFPIGRMRAVILTRPGNPLGITKLDDLLKPKVKVGIANPDRAAIGKVVRDHLRKQANWDALSGKLTTLHATVTDSANAVQLGGTDAAIVWDAVAFNYSELVTVRVPELDGAIGRVELALLKRSPAPAAARRFALYLTARDRGLSVFRARGFPDLEPGRVWEPESQP
ncbi:MAG: molybdate ABC transporter substrate-binding protein [Planctomycetia bacterium]|nr:molybdate ABC transporter substrate-binding protein [Planctomycetia bacterium]